MPTPTAELLEEAPVLHDRTASAVRDGTTTGKLELLARRTDGSRFFGRPAAKAP